jgi:hypothetical protein
VLAVAHKLLDAWMEEGAGQDSTALPEKTMETLPEMGRL